MEQISSATDLLSSLDSMSVSSVNISSSPNRMGSCLTKEEVQHGLDVFCETDCEDLYKIVRPHGNKLCTTCAKRCQENYKFAFLVLKSDGNVAKRLVEKWLNVIHDRSPSKNSPKLC